MTCVSTCTFASSQATNSPFIQMRSAVLNAYSLLLLEVGEDRPGGVLQGCVTAEVRRAEPVGEGAVHGRFYGRGVVLATPSVAQHHRHRAEHGQRIRLAAPGDVGRGAVHRLEQPWRARLA